MELTEFKKKILLIKFLKMLLVKMGCSLSEQQFKPLQ